MLSAEKWPVQMKSILLLTETRPCFDTRACFFSLYYQHWLSAETKVQNVHTGMQVSDKKEKGEEGWVVL